MKRRYEGGEPNGAHRPRGSSRPGRGPSNLQGSRSEARAHYNGGRQDERANRSAKGSLAEPPRPSERGPRPLPEEPLLFVEVPVNAVVAGGFIGIKGATVSSVRRDSGCKIHVRHDKGDAQEAQVIEFKGTKMEVDVALGILRQIVHSLDPHYELIIPDAARVSLEVAPSMVGYVIGKAGSGVRTIRQRTACWVHVEELEEGASAQLVTISGPIGNVRDAYFMLKDSLERVRAPGSKDTADHDEGAAAASTHQHDDHHAAAPDTDGPTTSPRARRARSPPPSDRRRGEPRDKRPRRDAPPARVSRKMGPMYSSYEGAEGYPPRRRGDRYADDPYRGGYERDDYYDPYAPEPLPYDPARPASGYDPRYDGGYPDVPDESRLAAPLQPVPMAAAIAQPAPAAYDSAYGVPMAPSMAAPQVQPLQVAAPAPQLATMAAPGQLVMAAQGSNGQVMAMAGGAAQAAPQVLMQQPDGTFKQVQVVWQLPDGTTTMQPQQQMLAQQPQQLQMQQPQQMLAQQPQQVLAQQPQQLQPQQAQQLQLQQQVPQLQQLQQQQQPQQMVSMAAAPAQQMYSYSQPTMAATSAPMATSQQILLDATQLQQTLLATSQALAQQQQQQTMMLQPQMQMQMPQQQGGVVQLMVPQAESK